MDYLSKLERVAEENENRIALSYCDRDVTYKELFSKSNNYASELMRRNIKRGENVCIIGHHSIELFACIIGIMRVNAVFVVIDEDEDIKKIEYRIRTSKTKYVFYDEDKDIAVSDIECIGLKEVYQGEEAESIHVESNPEDIMYMAFTSGSVSEEKAVLVSYDNLESYINDFISVFNVCKDDVNVQQTPLGYDGLCEEFFSMISSGGRLVLLDKNVLQSPRLLHKELNKCGATLFPTTPLMLNELNKLSPVETITRYISCADVLKNFYFCNLIKHAKIFNTYGLTETTVCSTFYLCSIDDEMIIPIGQAFPSSKVEVIDDQMKPLGINQTGEILIGGKGVTIGYLNNKELTKERYVEINGERFFRTGDYGYFDDNSILRYEGRKDSMEKLKGIKIDCLKIEESLIRHPLVKACLAHVCSYNGNSVLCMFYVPENSEVEETSIRSFLEKDFSGADLPNAYIQVDSIPLKSVGKVDYTELEDLFTKNRNKDIQVIGKNEEGVLAAFQKILGIDGITINDKLADIGVDSIFFIQIVLELEDLFEFEFDDNKLSYGDYETIKDVYEYVIKSNGLADR